MKLRLSSGRIPSALRREIGNDERSAREIGLTELKLNTIL